MKVGDAIKVKRPLVTVPGHTIGLIVDVIEADDGYAWYEVEFADDRGWFSDLELEAVNESR